MVFRLPCLYLVVVFKTLYFSGKRLEAWHKTLYKYSFIIIIIIIIILTSWTWTPLVPVSLLESFASSVPSPHCSDESRVSPQCSTSLVCAPPWHDALRTWVPPSPPALLSWLLLLLLLSLSLILLLLSPLRKVTWGRARR